MFRNVAAAVVLTACCVAGCDGCGQSGIDGQQAPRRTVNAPRIAPDAPGNVTVAGLLEQIVDLDRLMRPDATPYTWRQTSSTNVRSDPRDAKTWYGDDRGFVRMDGNEKVIFESSQPGAIARIWTANPMGRLRVYIDGSKTPVVDEDMSTLFAGNTGTFKPPFVYISAGGMNLIYPISWAKSVKIAVTSAKLYYTIDAREYASDVVVESYPRAPSAALERARARTEALLNSGFTDLSPNASHTLDSSSPEAIAELSAAKGGSVIRTTRLRLSSTDRAKLSRTALRVDIDGVRTMELPLSAALAPMSDAAGISSLPLSSSGKEWILRLPIPFANSARIALEDRGGGPITAELDLTVEPMPVTDATYRLFAAYVGPDTYDVSTWPALAELSSIQGQGRFVGLTLEVANDDPVRQWWGEGDPIVTVDDRPVMRGTGTEDHFLYAFCSTELFHSPFSGQTRANAANNGGLMTLYRFHTSDDVPFNSRFGLDLELLAWGTHHTRTITMQTSAVTWFYGRTSTKFVGATGNEKTFSPLSLPAELVRPGKGSVTCGPY